MSQSPSTFRLLLWPSLITLAVSIVRLVSEVNGWLTNVSGGRLLPLGITWCIFVFGGWMAWRLARAGEGPRRRLSWLWPLLALLAAIGTAMWGFRPLLEADRSEATFALVREAVIHGVVVAIVGALAMFAVWPRLCWTLLLYGLGARATVLAFTWLAKLKGWDTHYTKFGPPGIERDSMAETMTSAAIAQLGFWVPFTMLGGMFVGCLVARRRQ